MKNKLLHIKITLILAMLLCYSCVEELDLIQETSFESVLVIEATITDQFDFQEVRLTRSYALDATGSLEESNANVKVLGDDGSIYDFQQNSEGVYKSTVQFSAQQNVNYHLKVTTNGGNQYKSSMMQLTSVIPISNLYVERGFNENEDEGVSIFVATEDALETSKFYRYEYEETYKVIAPLYSPLEVILTGNEFPIPDAIVTESMSTNYNALLDYLVEDVRLREEQEQICYNTVKSNHIIITSTADLIEDDLEQFRIRFINRNNFIISHRYSILVRQFIQSELAYFFYKTLKSFSEEENLFSEVQTGFIEGNITSVNSQNNKVIGFFEVTSLSERRIFFSYEDLFLDDVIPSYYVNCDDYFTPSLYDPDQIDPGHANQYRSSPLVDAINEGFKFYDLNEDDNELPWPFRPYILVLEPCGDCTVLGNNNVPDFWVE